MQLGSVWADGELLIGEPEAEKCWGALTTINAEEDQCPHALALSASPHAAAAGPRDLWPIARRNIDASSFPPRKLSRLVGRSVCDRSNFLRLLSNNGAARGGGRGLSCGAGGDDARAGSARLGDDPEQSWRRAL